MATQRSECRQDGDSIVASRQWEKRSSNSGNLPPMWRHRREERSELEVSTAWKDATSPWNDPLPPFVSVPLQYRHRRRRRRRRRPVNWSRVRGCRAAGNAGVRHPRAVGSQASTASNTICNIDGRPAPERCEATLWSSGDCTDTCLWRLGLSVHHSGLSVANTCERKVSLLDRTAASHLVCLPTLKIQDTRSYCLGSHIAKSEHFVQVR